MQHTDWNDLSPAVRDLVQKRTGPVRTARTAPAGLNSQLAAVLDTADGPLFVKGLRTDHPGVVRQHREAMINPHVLSLAPPLRWQAEASAQQCTSWRKTPDKAINVFTIACARHYDEIAREDPQPWKKHFAAVAHDWAEHRLEWSPRTS